MQRESQIEKKLVKEIEKLGGLCWKFTSPGTVGVPDRVVILPTGKITFTELKAELGVLANIQKYRIQQLRDRGIDARVLRGVEDMRAFVKECKEEITNYDF